MVGGAGGGRGGGGGGALNLLQFEGLNHKCEIRGGVKGEECRDLLRDFFKKQRATEDVGGK